jgi:hypothetical protein
VTASAWNIYGGASNSKTVKFPYEHFVVVVNCGFKPHFYTPIPTIKKLTGRKSCNYNYVFTVTFVWVNTKTPMLISGTNELSIYIFAYTHVHNEHEQIYVFNFLGIWQ